MHFQGSMDAFRKYNALGGEGVYLRVTKDDRVLLVKDQKLASSNSRIQQVITKSLQSPLATEKDASAMHIYVTITKMHFKSSMESIANYNAQKGKGVYLHVTKDDRVLVVKDPSLASSNEKITRVLTKAHTVLKHHQAPENCLRVLQTFIDIQKNKPGPVSFSKKSQQRTFSVHKDKPDVTRSTATKIDREINAGYKGVLKKIPLEKLKHPSQQQLVNAIIDYIGCETFDQLHALDAMLHHAFSREHDRESFFMTLESLLTDPLPQIQPHQQYAHIQKYKNDTGWFYNKDIVEVDAETFSELYPDEELPDSWQEGDLIYLPEQRFSDEEVDDLIFKLEEITYIDPATRQILDNFFSGAPKNALPKAPNLPIPDSPTLDKQ